MNHAERKKKFHQFFVECEKIASAKSHDYADDEDAHKNYALPELLGVCKKEISIFCRLCEKLSRVSELLKKSAKVKDETIYETLHDMANIAGILCLVLEEKNKGRQKK